MSLPTATQCLLVLCLCGSFAAGIRANARDSPGGSPRNIMQLLEFEPALLQTMLNSLAPPAQAQPPQLEAAVAELPAARVPIAAAAAASGPIATSASDVKASTAAAPVAEANSTVDDSATLPMMRFVEEPAHTTRPEAPAKALDSPNGFAGFFDGMRFTVVRIEAIVAKVDWLQPYKQPTDSPFIGSGFVVESGDDDPIFLTNAHVVQDAHTVQVQLPAIGQMIFDAYVPLICKRFDLAVVQLKEPKKFWEALAQNNGTMHALPIRPSMVSLGLEVAAVGFPLGSSSLKLSRGIISGTEMVDGTICYQSTAPISPGSSGGPLFAVSAEQSGKVDDLQVIGVNFASSVSEGAQNVNYVVPTIHLLQVLHEFRGLKSQNLIGTNATQRQLKSVSPHQASVARTYPHFQLRIAPIDAIGIEASEALYNTSGGCQKGVFLSRILPTSALRFANPPVPQRSFLTAVDNVSLDSFGMGRTENFLGDPTPFESLMTLRERVDDLVQLTICQNGKETQHVVSIRWRPEYNVAVEEIVEPHFEEKAMDFEIFAGVTLMQMTSNHITDLLASGRPQTLSRWLLIENQEVPRLVVTHVEEGTYASRVLTPGMVVQQLNGRNVSTLAEFRENFQPQGLAWTLESDRGLIFSIKFKDSLAEQVTSAASSPGKHYLLSQAPLTAAKKMQLLSPGGPLDSAVASSAQAASVPASQEFTKLAAGARSVPSSSKGPVGRSNGFLSPRLSLSLLQLERSSICVAADLQEDLTEFL